MPLLPHSHFVSPWPPCSWQLSRSAVCFKHDRTSNSSSEQMFFFWIALELLSIACRAFCSFCWFDSKNFDYFRRFELLCSNKKQNGQKPPSSCSGEFRQILLLFIEPFCLCCLPNFFHFSPFPVCFCSVHRRSRGRLTSVRDYIMCTIARFGHLVLQK